MPLVGSLPVIKAENLVVSCTLSNMLASRLSTTSLSPAPLSVFMVCCGLLAYITTLGSACANSIGFNFEVGSAYVLPWLANLAASSTSS